MREKRKQHKWFPLLALGVICVVGVVLLCTKGKPHEAPAAPIDPHAGEIQVNDGASMVWLPRKEAPESVLTPADFSTDAQGWPVYVGDDHTALRGVDVSELQGSIDWQQAADAGIDFAFVRIGYRGYGAMGVLMEDSHFFANLEKAQQSGIKVGAYFFSQATSPAEAEEEAQFVLSVLSSAPLELPIMFDWERISWDESRTDAIPLDAISGYGAAFCRTIEQQSDYRAGVYFSRQVGYYGYDLNEVKDYAFWLADPGTYPAFYYAAAFWQYSVDATVPGIDTIVDMNLWFVPKETA